MEPNQYGKAASLMTRSVTVGKLFDLSLSLFIYKMKVMTYGVTVRIKRVNILGDVLVNVPHTFPFLLSEELHEGPTLPIET